MEEQAYQDIHQLEQGHWWYRGTRAVYQMLLHRYAPRTRNVGSILDLGCGTGGNLALLSRWGPVTGLDGWYPALRVCPAGAGALVQGQMQRLPFDDDTFALIAMLGVLEHVADDVDVLRQVRRVCRPGGLILLLTSAFMFLWSQHDEANHHVRRYTARELQSKAARAGLKARYVSYQNAFLFPAAAAVRLWQRLCPPGGEPRIDMFPMPEPINTVLAGLLALEGWLMTWTSLPVGVSLVAVLEA
jgi:SAM-dependent methyltransferase